MNKSESTLPVAFPPELRLLIAQLRIALGTLDPQALTQNMPAVDWEEFVRCVQRHRVAAFLHHHSPADAWWGAPAWATDRIRALAQANARRALSQTRELVRLVQLLRKNGISAVAIKGPLLARLLYGDVGIRHAGDVDLLLRPEEVELADGVLRQAGYRRSQPDFELTPLQRKKYQHLKHEYEYFNESAHIRVELAWRLASMTVRGNAVGDETLRKEILAGEEILTLPAVANAIYLFEHGARHAWSRLFWPLDIAMLLARNELPWQVLIPLANAHGAERAVTQGLLLVQKLFAVKLPDAFADQLQPNKRMGHLLAEAMRSIQADSADAAARALFRQAVYQLRLQSGWNKKLEVLRPRLMSPANWKSLRLPDSLFILYYVAAPILWLRRQRRKKSSAEAAPLA